MHYKAPKSRLKITVQRFSEMGCNASMDATAADPAEKLEQRPDTAASAKTGSAEETQGSSEKEKDEKPENPSCGTPP